MVCRAALVLVLVAMTTASGAAALEASVTLPVISPKVCANTGSASAPRTAMDNTRKWTFMVPPPLGGFWYWGILSKAARNVQQAASEDVRRARAPGPMSGG